MTITASRRAYEHGLADLHHFDHGVQNTANAPVELLKDRKLKISEAAMGEAEDDGHTERAT